MEEKIQNQINLIVQIITLLAALIQSINVIIQNKLFNFFIDKNIGSATSLFAIILFVLISSILKDVYLDLSFITNKLKNLIFSLLFLIIMFIFYTLSPHFPIPIFLIKVFQSLSYLFLFSFLFLILVDSIIKSLRKSNFKEKKKIFPQNLLETIKKYGAISTNRNLRLLGSYSLQPQDFTSGEQPFLNRNLFKTDNFLTDGKKYWLVKTDQEGLEIFFTKEITKEEIENFVKKFLDEHPLFLKI